ncbi:TSUP family transporter, partial [Pseudoclavibacter helvolus]|uniref:TSUP family transporter n=1 Tax=Pseudoclavibacter helvolus TaxID=255205 RepID=UPI000AF47FC8
SNESGMGTASIAASIAQTSHPVRQGLVSMTQTFVDTIVVISITGFVILSTGVWSGTDTATMTSVAFATGLPGTWGGTIVTICLVLLGYSTVLGWAYYGERNVERLAGARAAVVYRVVFSLAAGLGALAPLTLVWTFSDIMNGFMAVPNLIGLVVLSGLVVRETKLYLEHDPKFNATTAEVDAFMGTHPGALDAQIDHEVDLTSPTPALSETGSAPQASSQPPSDDDAAAPADSHGTSKLAAAGYGTLGGFTTMVANAGGPVMSMYFLAARFPKHAFLGTAAWFFVTMNLLKVPVSVGLGLLTTHTLVMDALLVPGVVVGALVGKWALARIAQHVFDRAVIAVTLLGAVYLLF